MKANLWDWLLDGRRLPAVVFEQLDRTRRWLGELLDLLGWGPEETPSRIVFRKPGVTLRCYGSQPADGPVLLVVPAPIKGPSIWDLLPPVSVVRRCLESGLRVYLIQ
jgi:polyhydroxyalkanoate synthase